MYVAAINMLSSSQPDYTMEPSRKDLLDDSPPPPAYSDQEFDRKIARVTDVSLEASPGPLAPDISEERWAEIEEAAFQAAIAASLADTGHDFGDLGGELGGNYVEPGPPSPPSTTTGPATRPLRIEKKTKLSGDFKSGKDQPIWLSVAEPSSSSQAGQSVAADEDDIAPPPFAENDPASHFNAVVGGNPPDSARTSAASSPARIDASPLPKTAAESVPTVPENEANFEFEFNPSQSSQEHNLFQSKASFGEHRQSMPASLFQTTNSLRTGQRPFSAISPSSYFEHPDPSSQWHDRPTSFLHSSVGQGAPNAQSSATMHPVAHAQPTMGAPLVSFNPSVAYGKSPFARHYTPPMLPFQEVKQEVYRASAFYNAVVSAHLPSTPQRTNDQRTAYSNSYSSANLPEVSYRSVGGSNTMDSFQQPTPSISYSTDQWARTPPNRPMSTLSADTTYSNNGVQYPISQQNWPPSTPERHYTGYYR